MRVCVAEKFGVGTPVHVNGEKDEAHRYPGVLRCFFNAVLHWFLGGSTQWLSTGSAEELLLEDAQTWKFESWRRGKTKKRAFLLH